jgi:hypothetical protein
VLPSIADGAEERLIDRILLRPLGFGGLVSSTAQRSIRCGIDCALPRSDKTHPILLRNLS